MKLSQPKKFVFLVNFREKCFLVASYKKKFVHQNFLKNTVIFLTAVIYRGFHGNKIDQNPRNSYNLCSLTHKSREITEKWQSGRSRSPAKGVNQQWFRRFESSLLRQIYKT